MLRKILDEVSLNAIKSTCSVDQYNDIVNLYGLNTTVEDTKVQQVKLSKSSFGLKSFDLTSIFKKTLSMFTSPKSDSVFVIASNSEKIIFPNTKPYNVIMLLKVFTLTAYSVPYQIGECILEILSEIDRILILKNIEDAKVIDTSKSKNNLLNQCRNEMFSLLKEAEFFSCLGITLS